MFCFNLVDARCVSTFIQRLCNVEWTMKEIYFVSSAQFRQTFVVPPKSKWSQKFIPLKKHQLSPYSCLALSSLLSLKEIQLPSVKVYFSRILHEGNTFLTPLPNRLWIYHGNCLYSANLYDLNSDKHKISCSPFVNFIAPQTKYSSKLSF